MSFQYFVLSGFVSVELVTSFHYLKLNFIIYIYMNSMIINIIHLKTFNHVEILKINCHKRKKSGSSEEVIFRV